MDIEITGESKRDVKELTLRLERHEREIINSAILSRLLSIAHKGEKLEQGGPLDQLSSLLRNENFHATVLEGINEAHLKELYIGVKEDNENIAYDKAKEVGGFVTQLSLAGRVLRGDATMITPMSSTEIDHVVGGIHVPDSPDGLS